MIALKPGFRQTNSAAKRILGGFVLLVCFTAYAAEPVVGTAGDAVVSQEQAQAPVYTTGGSWTYRAVDKLYDLYTSDVLNGDYEITFQDRGRKIFYLDGIAKLEAGHPGDLTHLVPIAAIIQAPAKYFDFPLWVGKKWKAFYFGGRKWFSAENTVTAIETVTTPAGSFRAFRIERRIVYSGLCVYPDGRCTFYVTEISFYSPEALSVVKYLHQFEKVIGFGDMTLDRTIDIELIKFGSGSSPVYVEKEQEQKLAPAPPSVGTSSTAATTEKKTEAPQKVETNSPPVLAEAKKAEEIAAPEEPALAGKAEEPSPAPAAEFQETALPADAMEEIVLAKESSSPRIAGPIALTMNLIGQRKEADGSYIEVLMHEGSALRSHDNFQVHLETSRYAYVYILLYDSQGKASQLFPDPKIEQPGFVAGRSKIVIPDEDSWFWLDESAGTETVYVLASEKPMADIRGLLARMESANEAEQKSASQEIKERIVVMQRGVGGITKGQTVTFTLSDGKKIEKVTDVVTGTGSVVRAVSFQHR